MPPAVVCPVCQHPVVIRIPKYRIHHAAHAPGDVCPVTRPETALHFNLKCLIATELRLASTAGWPLLVRDTCFVGSWNVSRERRLDSAPPEGVHRSEWLNSSPCPKTRERVWLASWDRVELESRVGSLEASLIPDITLYRGDELVGAIEVFHTHAVDDEKAAILAALEVPWIEVRADERMIEQSRAWTAREPLPIHSESSAKRWRCESHVAALEGEVEAEGQRLAQAEKEAEAKREAAEKDAEAKREAARHTFRVCAAKLVDVLYPSGKQWRNVYSVCELCTDGTPHSIVLQRNATTLLTLTLESQSKKKIWSRMKAKMEADIHGVEVKRGATTDSPMSWARGALAARMVESASFGDWMRFTHPPRYIFDKQAANWFIPEHLRDVRWDRGEDDRLSEPHAVWRSKLIRASSRPLTPSANHKSPSFGLNQSNNNHLPSGDQTG
jgi:hypothetical protein